VKLRWGLRMLNSSNAGLAGNAGLAVARTALDAVGSGVLVIVIARGLGANALGIYVYAATVGALIYALGSLSITQVLTREVARDPEQVRRLASAAIQLRAYLILPINVAAIALVALILPMTEQTRLVTVLLGVAVGLGFVTDVAFGLFQATGHFGSPLLITAVYKIATLTVAFALISRGGHVLDLAWAVVALQLGQTVLALSLVRRLVTLIDWWPQPTTWIRLATDSSPLAVSSLADTISNRADIVILGLLRPVSDVGIYSAAYNLYIGATVVVAAMQVALLPAFARSSEATFPQLWRRSAVTVCTVGALTGLLFLIFSGGLIHVAYGSTLAAAAQPLHILGPAAAVFVAERLLLTTLISRGWQRAVLYATIPGAVTNVVLNFATVPTYGYNGAAIATVGSELVVLLIAAFLAWRRVPALRASSAVQ
jgi:O-antigen/teichoic acid export membrane protein